MDYSYILTSAPAGIESKLTTAAEAASAEEVCMISFTPLSGNPALISLLDTTFL